MKNNKGITLTSLIIYVIGMLIVVGIIATFTSYFYKSINIKEINSKSSQYTRFSSLFLKEIKNSQNKVIDCKTSTDNGVKTSYIIFSSGNQYTYSSSDKAIYKNKIKITEDIQDCDFSVWFIDSCYNIKVNFKTDLIDMTGENAITYKISV